MHRNLFLRATLGCMIALTIPGFAHAAPASLVGPASVGEGAGTATYTVYCGDTPAILPGVPPLIHTGTLTVAVTDGPAPAASAADHGPSGMTTLLCSQATPQHTVEVPVTEDAADEPNERFTVTVSGTLEPPFSVVPAEFSQSVTTTIADDDVPTASVTELVRILEGDSGTVTAALAVTLSQVPVEPATIAYATENSSALAGSDFTAVSGELVIPAGQQTGTISVPIVGDRTPEKVEGFYVNLSSPVNATINPAKAQAAVAIFDSDKPPVPSFSLVKGVTVREGHTGTVNALFAVKLSSAATERTQVAWKTANFSANLADYAHGSGVLVFQPGQTAKTISVVVKGDSRDEPNEAFGVVLDRPVGATIAAKSGFGIITDDDGPKVSIGKPKVTRRALVTVLRCPATADRCTGRLVARAGKLKIGSAKFALAKGAKGKAKVKLSRKALAALRKRARRVKFSATAADASGAKRLVQRTYRIRRIR